MTNRSGRTSLSPPGSSCAIYAGRIRRKEQIYPGQHEPLIDPAAWDEIQATLISQAGGRSRGRRNASHPSPLASKIFDETGERLTPSHAASGDGRRRYYVSKRLIEKGGERASSGWRLPALQVEQTVVSIIVDHLGLAVATQIVQRQSDVRMVYDLDRKLKTFAVVLDSARALSLVEQITIAQGRIDIKLGGPAIASALELKLDEIAPPFLQCSRTFRMRRRGVESRLLLGDDPLMQDPALLRFISRAHVWWEQVRRGSTVGALAKREGVTPRLISLHLPAAFLAPDIVELILEGRQPPSLTAQALRTKAIPALWDDQRATFGIANPIKKIAVTVPAS
jgi:site-specific DNA recombinase